MTYLIEKFVSDFPKWESVATTLELADVDKLTFSKEHLVDACSIFFPAMTIRIVRSRKDKGNGGTADLKWRDGTFCPGTEFRFAEEFLPSYIWAHEMGHLLCGAERRQGIRPSRVESASWQFLGGYGDDCDDRAPLEIAAWINALVIGDLIPGLTENVLWGLLLNAAVADRNDLGYLLLAISNAHADGQEIGSIAVGFREALIEKRGLRRIQLCNRRAMSLLQMLKPYQPSLYAMDEMYEMDD